MITDILETLRQHDPRGPWNRAFAWTKPKVEDVPGGTVWTFYGRRSAEEPEGLGRVFVRQAEGEKLLSVTCGGTWWVDMRSPAETRDAEIRRRLAAAARRARELEGQAILAEEARARNKAAEAGAERIVLVHGDRAVIGSTMYRVSTVRGWALERGEDPEAAEAENARRRAAQQRYQDPDRGNEWFPSWSSEASLSPCPFALAAEPYCTARLGTRAEVVIEGMTWLVTGTPGYHELVEQP